MKTWEMIKSLTESDKVYGEMFFKCAFDANQYLLCFLLPDTGFPDTGSVQFRCIDFLPNNIIEVSDNPIIHTLDNWVEISKEEADIYLKGNYEIIRD